MKKNLKKAVVLLLALVMALTPVQAFAVEKRYFLPFQHQPDQDQYGSA